MLQKAQSSVDTKKANPIKKQQQHTQNRAKTSCHAHYSIKTQANFDISIL